MKLLHPQPQEHAKIAALLDSLPAPDLSMTAEEVRLSTPYSDLRSWIRMLRLDILMGKSRLQGPPGLRTRLERRYVSTTAREAMSRVSICRTRAARTAAGSEPAST